MYQTSFKITDASKLNTLVQWLKETGALLTVEQVVVISNTCEP